MAIKPLKTIKFPGLPDTYTIPQVDSTPTQGSTNAVSSGGVYEALQIEESQISPTWIEGGTINKGTGEFSTSSDLNWTYTEFYEIPKSSKIRLSVYASGNAAGVAFYTSNKTFISGTNVTSKTNTDLREYNVPTNAAFVRFTNNVASNYHPSTPLIILRRDKIDAIVDEIVAEIPQVDATPTQNSTNAVSSGGVYDALQNVDVVEYQISPTWLTGGLINKETGEFTESSDTNWTYTQFCEIPKSSKIRLSVYASGKSAGVAFYDNTETFISGTSVTSKTNTDLRECDVPSNAVFARFTNVIGSNYHPDTPLIIFLSDKIDTVVDEIMAAIPQVDATPTQNSTNAVSSGGVYDALQIVEHQIPQVDATPTQNSTNAVSSGGVYDALQNVDVAEYQISPAWFTGGLINKQANGAITKSDDANWTYTQFYKIPNTSSKIRLSVYASGKGLGVAFYNSIGTFISGTNITSKSNADLREYDIPTNAVFVRFTNNVASNYHPDTPLIIFLRNKTSVILEDKKESKYKQLTWRTGIQLNGAYSASDTRMCTVEPISIDKPIRISLADDWRAWVSYYKSGTWVKDGTSARYDGYVPESGYEIYITLAKRDNSAITDKELATASESIAVILTDQYEEARKAEQYAPNWASVSLFQKIGVLGDSFASGSLHYPDRSGSTTNYAVSWGQILARDTGASVTNYSKGGLSATTWLTDTEYGLEKLLSSDPEQLYICDFGINDWNQRSTYPIGTIADCKEDYAENPQTFYGSYGKIIGNIIDHAPNAKIVILSVMRNNERQIDGDIETIAEHFGLPFIKLTDDDFFVSEYYAQSMYGNHPLVTGYAGTAEAVKRLLCKCIMKNADYFRTYYG